MCSLRRVEDRSRQLNQLAAAGLSRADTQRDEIYLRVPFIADRTSK
jgi:hypothetical protein